MSKDITSDDMRNASLKIVHLFIEDGFTPTQGMFVTAMTLATMFKSQGHSMASALDKYIEVLTEVYENNNETKQ